MPRPKGSKNKSPRKTAKPTSISTTDFISLIAEKSSSKEALVADIATLEENLTSIREELKAKKAELEEMIQKLMADGVSAAEILEKLK